MYEKEMKRLKIKQNKVDQQKRIMEKVRSFISAPHIVLISA